MHAHETHSTWIFGVLLELVSTLSGTVGKQLLRFSGQSNEAGKVKAAALALNIGLFLNTVFGPVVDMAAYAFAPQSLLAPFGGLDIVWNMLIAPCTLGEALTPRRVIAVILLFSGTIATVLPADHTEFEYSVEVLHELLVRPRIIWYTLGFCAWLALNFLVLMPRPQGDLLRGFSLGATAGTIAGNMFCVKATAELIKTSIVEKSLEVWTDWLPYFVVAGAVFFAVSNVVFMTKGMQEYEALFMVTLYEGSMIVSNSISACVVLGEMDEKGWERIVWYTGCILTIVVAMIILISGEADDGGSSSDSSSESESRAAEEEDQSSGLVEAGYKQAVE